MITVEGLTKDFGTFRAVDGLTFTVGAGEIFGLVGPNGAGKTTTVRILTTLTPPTSGQGEIGGYDLRRAAPAVRRLIGYVPQMLSVDGTLTGYENLLLFARLYDLPAATRKRRIQEILAFFELEEVADALVRTYSGGMIRKLEIGQAMLHYPRVLFLDEPTVGLDPMARRHVWQHLLALQENYGTTIIVTTHYLEEAESLCQRVAIMNAGRIAAIGTPAELKAQTGRENANLEDAFAYFTGTTLAMGGNLSDTFRTRKTARRLG